MTPSSFNLIDRPLDLETLDALTLCSLRVSFTMSVSVNTQGRQSCDQGNVYMEPLVQVSGRVFGDGDRPWDLFNVADGPWGLCKSSVCEPTWLLRCVLGTAHRVVVNVGVVGVKQNNGPASFGMALL